MFIIVVGGGKVGYYLAKSLISSHHEVAIIEKDSSKCSQFVEDFGSITICGDGCDPAVLQGAGAERADIIVADTGDDEDNLIICQLAKTKYKVPRTIARVNNPKNEFVFKKLGIDSTVSSTDLVLSMIEQEVAYKGIAPLISFRKSGVEIVETTLAADSPAINKKIIELTLPNNCLILAVLRSDNLIIPDGNTTLETSDLVIALIRSDQLEGLQRTLVGTNSTQEIRR